MKRILALLLLIFTMQLSAAAIKSPKANLSDIRVVPVNPTPEADNVHTHIVFPKPDQVISSRDIHLQLKEAGFPLGTSSDFARARQLYNDPQGQNIRVIIDDYPPFGVYKTFVDSLDDNNLYFDKTLNKEVPYSLKPGKHVLHIFPVRSYGESLKGPGNFSASIFYTEEKKDNLDVNLSRPYLTYNEPQGEFPYKEDGAILLDFYITNVRLSQDGYKVRLSIDGDMVRTLTMWVPYYLMGLSKGEHTIRLELLDPGNKKVPGAFNDITKTIRLK